MLTRFSVENFKGFKDRIELDLSCPCSYDHNSEVISDHYVTKGIIYGPNGSGKSNLGYAIFDIVSQLTDKKTEEKIYRCYLNLERIDPCAKFEYTFIFDGVEVSYWYMKKDLWKLKEEHLYIDGKEVISYDFERNEGFTVLDGSQTLLPKFNDPSAISRVKFVAYNSILADNKENLAFKSFMRFINGMLLFYSLDKNIYLGFTNGSESISEGIIEKGKLQDFQQFLLENGISYDLKAVDHNGRLAISCHFDRYDVDFFEIASTGTISLSVLYYWYIRMLDASFVYIDDLDAFYHFELAEGMIKRLREMDGVQIFVTTHNTDLMSNDLLRPDCYFILRNNKIRSVENSAQKELRKAHNLQKMYKAGAFNGDERS